MCESTVLIMRKDGKQETLMEDVVFVSVEGSRIRMVGILGDVKEVNGRIKEVNLTKHTILMEEI
ncbi:MAG: CooT family nickel-binding protein [Candidatus Methanospirare jalkutatii]|nr:CooT family nickel-binding protein [Methanophagales archaeon]MCW3131685.1 CooT family nickel-binding protein [Candidatus Methanospirare jalkutatii]MCW7079669.1 CooT family nickel-binding protein [Candidatus Methanospirare jalkutatii]